MRETIGQLPAVGEPPPVTCSDQAEVLGASAVLSMRLDASEISNFMTEVVAYGTAAVIEPSEKSEGAVADLA